MIAKGVSSYKQAYTGLSRETWLLSLVMLVNRSGTMVVPFLSLYLTSSGMGYTLSQAGYVMGFFGSGAFTGAYIGGKLTDKIGFRQVQFITLVGGGLLFIALGQMRSYPLICAFTFLLSFINEAFRPANSTAIAFYSKEENRTRSYSLNRLAINLGWAIGSTLGGVIAHFNYQLLFWVDGLTNIGAACLLYVSLKPVATDVYHRSKAAIHTQVKSAYKDGVYLWFIFCSFLFAACFFQLFTNVSVYFKRDVHFTEPFIGLLMATNGVIIVLIEMVLVHWLEKKNTPVRFIMIGVFITGLSFWILNLAPMNGVTALLMVLAITIGEILAMPFMNTFWISRSNPVYRGQYAALYTMAWSAAQTLGPMLGAQLADNKGFKLLWWVIGGVCIVAVAGYGRLLHIPVSTIDNLNEQDAVLESEIEAVQDMAG